MSPENHIVLKVTLGYGAFFAFLWLILALVILVAGEAGFSVKGFAYSFVIMQLPTALLALKTKLNLSKNPIQ